MTEDWVHKAWESRNDIDLTATAEPMVRPYKILLNSSNSTNPILDYGGHPTKILKIRIILTASYFN